MRLNKFLAAHTDLSRRAADKAIADGRVEINGLQAHLGDVVIATDTVTLDNSAISPVVSPDEHAAKPHAKVLTTDGQNPVRIYYGVNPQTIVLNKPVGYVCSRAGQGSKTVYDLLPQELHYLNPVGRLDKDSSGLLLLTNDGDLANRLTHPRYQKAKVYQVELTKSLEPLHHQMIADFGVQLDDGPSRFQLTAAGQDRKSWLVTMSEGRNRQIRRTFAALGYKVMTLHRTHFGPYALGRLKTGDYKPVDI